MRPRASQVARIRLVETEEDVETVHEDDGLSVLVHWPDTPLALSGGRLREQGVGSVSAYPHPNMQVSEYEQLNEGVGRN